jgi:hypothetical protein
MPFMKIDPIPVWQFFDIPEDAIELCYKLSSASEVPSQESQYWKRAAQFLKAVKARTVDNLPERDFDWMLKLRVQFEKEVSVKRSVID